MNTKDRLSQVLDGITASTIEVVDLTGSKVRCYDDSDVADLVAALSTNTSVTRLDLSLNAITDEGVSLIGDFLAHHQGPLRELALDSNKFSSAGLLRLVDHLPPSISRLDVSGNKLAAEGVGVLLVRALRRSQVQTLAVRDVGLTNEDINPFCEWISDPNCMLKSLEISGNEFSDDILDGLRRSLEFNTSLRHFNISNCRIFDMRPLLSERLLLNTGLSSFLASSAGKRFTTPELEQTLKENKQLYNPQLLSPMSQLKAIHTLELRNQRILYERRIAALEQQLAAK